MRKPRRIDDVQKRASGSSGASQTIHRNALEDIETKRIKREAELNKEIEAAVKITIA